MTGDLIRYHKDCIVRLSAPDKKGAVDPDAGMKCMYHEYSLEVLAMKVMNVKAEANFSLHKRILEDKHGKHPEKVSWQIIGYGHPAIKGKKLTEVDLNEFKHVKKFFTHSGGGDYQQAKLKECREELTRARREELARASRP